MLRRATSRNLIRAAMCLLPWILGCAGTKLHAPSFDSLPVLSVSDDELIAHLHHEATAVTRLKGKLEIGMSTKPGDAYKRCRAILASQSPWNGTEDAGLFLEGYRRLIPTLFTLVSDGREFWLHVPYDNVVYTGPIDGPHPVRKGHEIHLDVGDLFRALFVQPLDSDSLEIVEEGAEYTVSLRDKGQLQRRLWVERRLLSVRREVYYGAGGEPRLEIDRDPPTDFEAALYPAKVVLRDVASGGSLLLEFGSVTVNPEKLAEGIFRPKIPLGARIDRTDANGGRT